MEPDHLQGQHAAELGGFLGHQNLPGPARPAEHGQPLGPRGFRVRCALQDAPGAAFIDYYMSDPAHHAAFSKEMGYTTSNLASHALLSPDEKKELISTPEMLAGIIKVDAVWLNANRAIMLNRWNAWVSS